MILFNPLIFVILSVFKLTFSLERFPGDLSVHQFMVPDPKNDNHGEIKRLVERICKFLLWQQGASRIGVHSSDGSDILLKYLAEIYNENGPRAFDSNMMERAFGSPLVFESLSSCEIEPNDASKAIGGHLDGCRIGFDLGASDYKLAAVKNGEPVFTTEIPSWAFLIAILSPFTCAVILVLIASPAASSLAEFIL